MKTKTTSVILTFFCLFQNFAQIETSFQPVPENSAQNPCISEFEYQLVEERCKENKKTHFGNFIAQKTAVPLSWPLRAADGFTDCGHYYISAHVDHNASAGVFQDYNCGTIAYDGHRGTDIAIGPFGFYKMDNRQVEIIAAADGTIIDKHDGEFDRNCVGNNLTANYVILLHADGSQTYYWHMKSGNVTTKAIGETVIAGEYLGVVGSSGSSSGPHLHFEVRTGNTSATMVDPFAGTCNTINAQSFWLNQKPYTEPAVLKASVHTTDVVMPGCPTTETPNESASYSIPFQGAGLPAGFAKFYLFLRNETSNTVATMTILNPNGTVFNTWTKNLTGDFKFSYYGFSKALPVNPGIYTFQATYNGVSCAQQFEILDQNQAFIEMSEANSEFTIYPNPSNSDVTLIFNEFMTNTTIMIFDQYGKCVQNQTNISGNEYIVRRENLSEGIYFISLQKGINNAKIQKLIIIN